jgi:UDP-N-acetylglucosamine--N-acetylmuramyl-(pentapeptide) pyrophosphoryl-undecaprenol N-acetylglucosamine transferase
MNAKKHIKKTIPKTTSTPPAPCAVISAGGTGGHIFPALAVANRLIENGWQVCWIGKKGGMETKIVSAHNIPLKTIDFTGVRGQGLGAMLLLPWRLCRAMLQVYRSLKGLHPQVALGFGGYISFPTSLVAVLKGMKLIIHEQNATPGSTNRILTRLAWRTLTTFPNTLKGAEWVGNPLRQTFFIQPDPGTRYQSRSEDKPIRLLVLGGSLGAKAINELVVNALAQLDSTQRPIVLHQSGRDHVDDLQKQYEISGVTAEVKGFIDDVASALAWADIVIARAGAGNVCEIAAVGVASLLIPFPYASDDHQTKNAQYLSQVGAATLIPQRDLNPQKIADWIKSLNRHELQNMAKRAKKLAKTSTTKMIVEVCTEAIKY